MSLSRFLLDDFASQFGTKFTSVTVGNLQRCMKECVEYQEGTRKEPPEGNAKHSGVKLLRNLLKKYRDEEIGSYEENAYRLLDSTSKGEKLSKGDLARIKQSIGDLYCTSVTALKSLLKKQLGIASGKIENSLVTWLIDGIDRISKTVSRSTRKGTQELVTHILVTTLLDSYLGMFQPLLFLPSQMIREMKDALIMMQTQSSMYTLRALAEQNTTVQRFFCRKKEDKTKNVFKTIPWLLNEQAPIASADYKLLEKGLCPNLRCLFVGMSSRVWDHLDLGIGYTDLVKYAQIDNPDILNWFSDIAGFMDRTHGTNETPSAKLMTELRAYCAGYNPKHLYIEVLACFTIGRPNGMEEVIGSCFRDYSDKLVDGTQIGHLNRNNAAIREAREEVFEAILCEKPDLNEEEAFGSRPRDINEEMMQAFNHARSKHGGGAGARPPPQFKYAHTAATHQHFMNKREAPKHTKRQAPFAPPHTTEGPMQISQMRVPHNDAWLHS